MSRPSPEALAAASKFYGMEQPGPLTFQLAEALDAFAAQAVQAAVEQEREACAQLCTSDEGQGDIDYIAMLIRARGAK